MRKSITAAFMTAFLAGCAAEEEITDDKKIAFRISTHDEQCKDENFPVAVTIENNAKKSLLSRTILVSASQKGHSSSLFSKYVKDDTIIKPGYELTHCLPDKLASNLSDLFIYGPPDLRQKIVVLDGLAPDQIQYEAQIIDWWFGDAQPAD